MTNAEDLSMEIEAFGKKVLRAFLREKGITVHAELSIECLQSILFFVEQDMQKNKVSSTRKNIHEQGA